MSLEILNLYDEQINQLRLKIDLLNERQLIELDKFPGLILTKTDVEGYLFNLSKGSKRYVMIDYHYSFIIRRMMDNVDLSQVYKSFIDNKCMTMEGPNEFTCGQINKYLSLGWFSVNKVSSIITEGMYKNQIVSYAWLQRNTSSAPIFKRMGQPTEVLKIVLDQLVNDKKLFIVNPNEFGIKAKLYRINSDKFYEVK